MPRLGHFGKVGLPGPLGLSALRHLLLIFDLIAGDQFNPTVNHKIKSYIRKCQYLCQRINHYSLHEKIIVPIL